MDVGDFARLIARRWYVGLPLLVATLAGVVLAIRLIAPNYVLTSYVQLVPPTAGAQVSQSGANGQPRNPWNVLGLAALSQAAMYATQDQTFLDQLQSGGHSTNFTMEVGYPNPVVTIVVTAPTKAEAESTTDLIVKRYEQTAQTLQSHYEVKAEDMITTRRLDEGENTTTSSSRVKRMVLVIAAGGVLASVAVTIAVDALLRRRRGAKATPSGAAPLAERVPGAQPAAARPEPLTEIIPLGPLAGHGLPPAAAGNPRLGVPAAVRHRPGAEPGADQPHGQPRPENGVPSDATIVLSQPKWQGGQWGKRS